MSIYRKQFSDWDQIRDLVNDQYPKFRFKKIKGSETEESYKVRLISKNGHDSEILTIYKSNKGPLEDFNNSTDLEVKNSAKPTLTGKREEDYFIPKSKRKPNYPWAITYDPWKSDEQIEKDRRWDVISNTDKKMSNEFMLKHKNDLIWRLVAFHQRIPEDVLRKCADRLDHAWSEISEHQKLSEDFIRDFQNEVDWNKISLYQTLSEDFIREFRDKINWRNISLRQNLSDDFIKEFKDKLDWSVLCTKKVLSEDLMRACKDKLVWSDLARCQNLSKKFILDFKDRIFKDWLKENPNISPELYNEVEGELQSIPKPRRWR